MHLDGPAAIRYPRDQVPEPLGDECPPFELGRGRVVSEGTDGTFLCYGAATDMARTAAGQLAGEGLSVGVANARFAKPLDAELIEALLADGKFVLTCEDHVRPGGFGEAVLAAAARGGWPTDRIRMACLPDRFIAHASRREQLHEAGLDAEGLARTARLLVDRAAGVVETMDSRE